MSPLCCQQAHSGNPETSARSLHAGGREEGDGKGPSKVWGRGGESGMAQAWVLVGGRCCQPQSPSSPWALKVCLRPSESIRDALGLLLPGLCLTRGCTMAQCRDLENHHHEKLLEISISTLEKIVKGDLDEDLPDDLRAVGGAGEAWRERAVWS